MRFKNGLALFQRTNSKGNWNLASFHSPHSLTWSWLLHFSLPGREGRWFGFYTHPGPNGPRWGLQFFRFNLHYQTQRPIWYRDMYHRLRDERDSLLPVEDRPLPHSLQPTLTVIDGGNSLH